MKPKTLTFGLVMAFAWGDKYNVRLLAGEPGNYTLEFTDNTRNLAADLIPFKTLEDLDRKYADRSPGSFLRLYVGSDPEKFTEFRERVEIYLGPTIERGGETISYVSIPL